MSFEESSDEDVSVDLPDDFVIPKPQREKSGRFARKAPPEEKASRTATTRKPAVRIPNKRGQFIDPVDKLYKTIGMLIMPIQPSVGQAFIAAAPECARYWDELAYQNESVRKFIFSVTQTSLTWQLIMAHLPIFMAVFLLTPIAQKVMGQMGEKMAETIAEQMKATENGGGDTPNAD